jgi:hypothetical protein
LFVSKEADGSGAEGSGGQAEQQEGIGVFSSSLLSNIVLGIELIGVQDQRNQDMMCHLCDFSITNMFMNLRIVKEMLCTLPTNFDLMLLCLASLYDWTPCASS